MMAYCRVSVAGCAAPGGFAPAEGCAPAIAHDSSNPAIGAAILMGCSMSLTRAGLRWPLLDGAAGRTQTRTGRCGGGVSIAALPAPAARKGRNLADLGQGGAGSRPDLPNPPQRGRTVAISRDCKIGIPGPEDAMKLQSLGYVGLRARNLEDWASFGEKFLGMQLVERSRSALRLRMDDRSQRLLVEADSTEGIGFFDWEVADSAALESSAARGGGRARRARHEGVRRRAARQRAHPLCRSGRQPARDLLWRRDHGRAV